MKYYCLDFETYLIEDHTYPKPVCLSWCSDDQLDLGIVGNFQNDLRFKVFKFLTDCSQGKYYLVFHNGFGFDLLVMWFHFPEYRNLIIDCLDKGYIKDTLIREKLKDLSTLGFIKTKRGSYTLLTLVKKYSGKDFSEYKEGDDIWRMRYADLDGMKALDYPQDAQKYCLLDVKYLAKVYQIQEDLRKYKGYGSFNTEELQIKSGFVLNLVTYKGLKVNRDKLDEFEFGLDTQLAPLRKTLIDKGFAKITKKNKFTKENKKFIQYLETTYPEYVSKTQPSDTYINGQTRIDSEALAQYPDDPIVKARLNMSLLEKYKTTYCKNIRKAGLTFRSRYDILKETGRTSSFIQTMPREGGIRELFQAREGYKYLAIDFCAIEACSIAQTMKDLKLGTTLLDYLNKSDKPQDYHCLLGHLWYAYQNNILPNLSEFIGLVKQGNKKAKEARNASKPGGLSIAGGIGNTTMTVIARGSGITITEDEAQIFRDFAYQMIPEIKLYLGERGWMGDQKKSGDYDYAYAYEVNGRYRNRCTYCSCANGRSMQSPAADGAKKAIWEVFKVIYTKYPKVRILAFIHDELIFEIPNKDMIGFDLNIPNVLAKTMCQGMKKILPDIRIATEWSIMDYWTKDESKHLLKGKIWI